MADGSTRARSNQIELSLSDEGVMSIHRDRWMETNLDVALKFRLSDIHERVTAARALFTIVRRDVAHAEDAELHKSVHYKPLDGYIRGGLLDAIGLLLRDSSSDFEAVLERCERPAK